MTIDVCMHVHGIYRHPDWWSKGRFQGVKAPEVINTHCRASVVLPDFVHCKFGVHNGKDYVRIEVQEAMIGHKLGEFSPTRKIPVHKNKAGIGRTLLKVSSLSPYGTGNLQGADPTLCLCGPVTGMFNCLLQSTWSGTDTARKEYLCKMLPKKSSASTMCFRPDQPIYPPSWASAAGTLLAPQQAAQTRWAATARAASSLAVQHHLTSKMGTA
eukprot:366028-Chlamydomonas_euryale.AAC.12